ncbi:6928_t:CDS:1, partial [Paraglomus brasilianum]
MSIGSEAPPENVNPAPKVDAPPPVSSPVSPPVSPLSVYPPVSPPPVYSPISSRIAPP